MFTRFFGNRSSDEDGPRSLGERYASWRFSGDVTAIMACFDRLSDRRLALIGMRREELFEAVSDLMLRAEEERRMGREAIELLENPPVAPEDEGREDRPEAAPESRAASEAA
ncbi:hypothetical protein [Pseudoponticoccus marisrubri]|uniref:Uncharacterized protein n=1 Tax=Pseudoponticoccus marisrubri TaxID=1685382 RepID=A0A0W7WNB2_9RHOB|nr:hypothetical protein [Pseudoponticoccus marisrubri]KUF11988.1 hypothetical protein AVJ23_05270 [Pseudoponticoccus marisrubri]